MHLAFIDDAQQANPTRPGMRPLVATGGIVVRVDAAGSLESELSAIRTAYGFPDGEEFKWSPDRDDWMRDNLVAGQRRDFFVEVLAAAGQVGVVVLVMISDTDCNPATNGAPTPQFDTTVAFLERVHNYVNDEGSYAVVIADRPGGGTRQDTDFLVNCQRVLTRGTRYVTLDRLPINLVTTESNLVRLLQLADLVTSCTTAFVAGENEYSPTVFGAIHPLVRREYDCYGGRGIKIHPDFRYRNLYHWLLGDSHFTRFQAGSPLPDRERPYAEDAVTF